MFAAVSSSKSVSTLLRRLFTIGGKIVVTKHKDYPRYFFFHAVIRIPLHTNNNPHQSFFLPYLFVTNSPVFPKCVSLCYLFATATNHLLLLFSSSSPWKKKKYKPVCRNYATLFGGQWFYNGGMWNRLCNVKWNKNNWSLHFTLVVPGGEAHHFLVAHPKELFFLMCQIEI